MARQAIPGALAPLMIGAAALLGVSLSSCHVIFGEDPVNVSADDTSTMTNDVDRRLAVVVYTDGEQPVRFLGYTAVVDGVSFTLEEDVPGEHVMVHGRVLEDVLPGARSVELLGIADNCTLDGANPRSVEIPSGSARSRLDFEVTCFEDAGDLAIRTYTAGVDLDPDGYLLNFDGVDRSIGIDDRLVFADIPTGSYTVRLSDVADNCWLLGDNPVEALVQVATTTTVNFDVRCDDLSQLPVVFIDHFDDDALDPVWEVSFSAAESWVFEEAGTWLTITDVVAEVPPDPNCAAAAVYLTRSFTPVDDLALRFNISWDSEDDVLAMQSLFLNLYTTDGERVFIGFNDAWSASSGELIADIDGATSTSGAGALELSGGVSATVTRSSGLVEVSFGDLSYGTGTLSAPFDRLQLVARQHNCRTPTGDSYMGEVAVDVVELRGEPAP